MVEAIARGVAKASLFTATSPQCARQLHWKRFPQSKPTGADEATLARNDDRLVAAVVGSMDKARRLDGGQAWAASMRPASGRMQDFLFDNKVIDRRWRRRPS